MSGGGRRATKAPAPPEKPPPEKPAAEKRSGRAAAAAASPAKPKKGGAAATADARQDALAEARDMAEAVANDDEGINDKPPSPPPVAKKSERAVTLELQKEKAERAKLQAETERLKKQLDDLVKEKKRKESDAAEQAPPAKRAVGSGRRSVPQSAAVSRRRQYVLRSQLLIFGYIIMTP